MQLLSLEYFSLFLIITLGILLGKIKIRGISFDISAVIFVALIFGHFGIIVPPIFQQIGLILFIFTIGIQAGPGFFESFKKKGAQLVAISSLIVVSGGGITLLMALLFDIDFKIAVGLFTGALTSTPGLAAAIESAKSPLASIGYGIAYPFGVIGVILFVRLIHKFMKIDLRKEEQKFREETAAEYPAIHSKHFVVENENILEKSIRDLDIRSMTGANVSRVLHEGEAFVPSATTVLHKGDIIKAVGTDDALKKIGLLIGKETDFEIPRSGGFDVQWVLVTNKFAVNKTLGQLNLFENYSATVTRIRRSGIDITPSPSSQVRFGDKLMIASPVSTMASVGKLMGNNVKRLNEADFLPVSAGIIIGILLGQLEIPLFGTEIKPGLTGGILIASLTLSRIGKTGPIIWNISGPANQLLRQLGLIFFLAAVGTSAGQNLVETLSKYGITYFAMGIAITLVPMIISILLGYYVFKINYLTLLGSITGGMTSTPGLSALDPMTESNAPHIAYATVYPFAMVLLIVIAQIFGFL